MTVWLVDFPITKDERSASGADMIRLVSSLRSGGNYSILNASTAAVDRPLRALLQQVPPTDAIFGTTDLLRGEPGFRLSQKTQWLADAFFSQGRQVLAGGTILRQFRKHGFAPYFIKSVEEKGHPAPTLVRTASTHARISRQFLARQPSSGFLVGPVFQIESEERFFCVDGRTVASQVYSGRPDASRERSTLAESYLKHSAVRNLALDIASTAQGVFIIETNPLFCAGLYGVDPRSILVGCTRRAIEQDYPFLRDGPNDELGVKIGIQRAP